MLSLLEISEKTESRITTLASDQASYWQEAAWMAKPYSRLRNGRFDNLDGATSRRRQNNAKLA